MKKLTAVLMSLMLIFGLAACGGREQPADSGSADPSGNKTETAAESGSAGTGKTLVVYYSATGNTEDVASYIAKATDGELFQLEPETPYSDADLNWTDESSRVVKEHENPDERDVKLKKDTTDNWDSYDTVFIGYPIWWHTAPMTVGTFLERYDLSGKQIYPVSQSASMDRSQYTQSVAFVRDCAKGASVDSGIFSKDTETIRAYIENTVLK